VSADRQERLTVGEAQALAAAALGASNVASWNAASVARGLVAAEVDGQGGHGLSRVAPYAAQAASGKVDGNANPAVRRARPALLAIDAANGFAFPAIDAAFDPLVSLAYEAGLAGATFDRSHHAGQLGAHVERLAGEGLVALMVANTPRAMAAWGGATPLFGTNPIAFAAPRGGRPPLVVDLSLSIVARGKIMAAAQRGERIPEGWALDPDGAPTTDPRAALEGTMIPAGGAKGAALALMVEILAATLTGANASREASSFFEADGSPPGVGHFVIAIDPDGAADGFAERLDALATAIEAEPNARIPGEGRLARRAEAAGRGIAVPAATVETLRRLAGQ